MRRLERIARAIDGHQQVARLTADPDPAPSHDYEPDPQSGAGNCLHCGRSEHHRKHPHPFTAAASNPSLCACALPPAARCHTAPAQQSRADRQEGKP